jgi:hypothetical protein
LKKGDLGGFKELQGERNYGNRCKNSKRKEFMATATKKNSAPLSRDNGAEANLRASEAIQLIFDVIGVFEQQQDQ